MKVPTGYKETKIGIIPKDWDVVRLGDKCSKVNSKNTLDEIKLVFSNSAREGIIIQKDYFKKSIANKANLKGYYLVEKDSFVYNPRISKNAPVGPLHVNHNKDVGLVSPLYTVFKLNSNSMSNYFLEYFFKTEIWHGYMRDIANYGARHDRMSIGVNDFFKMPIPLPPISEQVKIAEVLGTVDSKIMAIEQEINETQTLKKGLMQQLLTGKISVTTQPHTFKTTKLGKIPHHWQVEILGNVGEIITGKTPSTNNHNFYNGKFLFVSPADLGNTRFITRTRKTLTLEGFEKVKTILKGNPLVTCIGSTIGKIGIAGEDLVTNQQINSINVYQSKNKIYIYYALLYRKNFIKKLAGIHAVPIVNKSLFSEVLIPLPPLSEQKKIADILGTVDDKINILNSKKEDYSTLKKGLMQQLLTGKIRVGS